MGVLVKLVIPGMVVEKEVVRFGQTVVVARFGKFLAILVVTVESGLIIPSIILCNMTCVPFP